MSTKTGIASQLSRLSVGAQVSFDALRDLGADILVAAGLSSEDAKASADVLAHAQLSGVDTHGFCHLAVYVRRLLEGSIAVNPRIVVTKRAPVAAVMDGGNGLGALVAQKAMAEAIDTAAAFGIGACAVRNSSHFGAANFYVEQATRAGMIGLVFSNAAPSMAPWGGREAILGTNPIAFGFPRANAYPIVVDMATSAVARSRLRKAANAAAPIPPFWALDRAGEPTTDSRAALDGTIQPVGGAKGYALSLAVELLCVALSGGRPGFEVRNPHDKAPEPCGTSHLFIALAPNCFAGNDVAADSIEAVVRRIEQSEPRCDEKPRLPGQRGAQDRASRSKRGIPVTHDLLESLRKAAELVDSAFPPQVRNDCHSN